MTMGGEPTFVSIDDMESEQWNTAADGKEKRILSHDLIFRLRDLFGPGGLIHYGQGKWYPGELCCAGSMVFSGKDGYPIWHNLHLIAHEKQHASTHMKMQKVRGELAKRLAVSTDNISAAYEDVFFFCGGRKTPVNIDPLKTI